ncbi:MAG TPA: hypothetical protein VE641_14280 [Chthoniobacterales bacterium]|nr:hypothetical protein [Chthoniobacterales bacterium]
MRELLGPDIFLRPKGDNRIARGFSPEDGIIRKIALKVAAEAGPVQINLTIE